MRIYLKKPSNGNQLPKSLGTSLVSSKGLHSIESSITVEARIANLARRMKALETKEPVLVNQVNPNQLLTPSCTYYQAMNHVLEECPVFHAQQMLSEHMNATYSSMVQSLGLGRRLGRHRDGSVSATRIGLGRYAQNAT